MMISVIICTYQTNRYNDLLEAIQSLKNQTYINTEIIVVVDGNKELYELLKLLEGINIFINPSNVGLSESRNNGIKQAKGDIIAFLDDDAIADENWIQELINMYESKGVISVGGKILPKWLSKKPSFLPEEFYWLIGATHKGFPEKVMEVRNTFGSNISFKAEVLRELGGFKSNIGIKGKAQLQAEEVDLCERMRQRYGKGVIYNPQAIVYHKIFPERLKIRFLLRRAFWQGYSKRMMKEIGYQITEEHKFLRVLFNSAIEKIQQLIFLFVFTFAVGVGYLFRILKIFILR